MKAPFRVLVIAICCVLSASSARAQVQTGSITGSVTDSGGAVLPGVTISLSGERLIGGAQTQVTDATGGYRFDRLPPGTYRVKFELQGFRPSSAPDVRISAAFVATINAQAGGRHRHRDDHGHRRVADGRRPVERAADGHEPGDPRRRPDRPRSVVARQADPRRAGRDLRRRRHAVDAAEQHVGARLEHQRRQLQHRRRHGELAGRRRRRDDDLLRPGHVRRSQLHDLGDSRRSAGRRRLDQHGDQGRRQPVEGQRPLQLRQRRPAGRELGATTAERRSQRPSSATRPRRPTTSTCRAAARIVQNRVWVNGTDPQVGGQQAGQRARTPTAARRSTTTT